MWWMMAVQGGINLLSDSYSYATASASYKNQKKFQEYSNKMTNISNALNQNAITANVLQAQRQGARQSGQIKQQGNAFMGQVNVQAAATGTVGQSVNQTRMAVAQAQANAQFDVDESLNNAYISAYYQRIQSAQSAAMQQDYSVISEPNALAYLHRGLANTFNMSSTQLNLDNRSADQAKMYTNNQGFTGGTFSWDRMNSLGSSGSSSFSWNRMNQGLGSMSSFF